VHDIASTGLHHFILRLDAPVVAVLVTAMTRFAKINTVPSYRSRVSPKITSLDL
jgi:hypothetical protein